MKKPVSMVLPAVLHTYIGVKESDVVDIGIAATSEGVDLTPHTEAGDSLLSATRLKIGEELMTVTGITDEDAPLGVDKVYSMSVSDDRTSEILYDMLAMGVSATLLTCLSVSRTPDVYLFLVPTAHVLEDIKADAGTVHDVVQIQYSVSKRGRVFVSKFGAEMQQGSEACAKLSEEWNIGITSILACFIKDGQVVPPNLPTA